MPTLPRQKRRTCDVTACTAASDPDLASAEISQVLADQAANLVGGEGEIAVLAGACGDAFEAFRSRLVRKHPSVILSAVLFGDDDEDRAFTFTQDVLRFCSSLKLIVSLSPESMRGASAAVFASNRRSVKVIGPGSPEGGPRQRESIDDLVEPPRSRLDTRF